MAGASAWYWIARPNPDRPAVHPVSVATAIVTSGDLLQTVRLTGTIAAEKYASIAAPRIQGNRSNFNRGGPGGMGGDFDLVLTRLADPGSPVKAGDVVVEFDRQAQELRLDDYEDSLIQHEANLNRLTANLAASAESLQQQVRVAKADYDKARLDWTTAPIRPAIDAEKLNIAVDQTREQYEQMLKQADLLIESQRAQIRAEEIDRDQARMEVQRAQTNLERMTIRAPIPGLAVLQTLFRQGQLAQVRVGDRVFPGQTFLIIVDPRSMVVDTTVNQVDAQRVRLGQRTRIRLDAYPEMELPGTVTGIGAMSKTSATRAGYVGQIPIRLKVECEESRLIPDLTAGADVLVASEKSAVIVPRAAVFEEEGKAFVFLRRAEGWVRRPIERGLSNHIAVAVRSGLRSGDTVALQRPM